MKKKIAALVIAGAMFAFSGCGSTASESAPAESTVSEVTDGESTAAESSGTAESAPAESTEAGDESAEASNSVGDIILDDAPVSDMDFTADKVDDFITLAAYNGFSPYAPEGTEVKMGDTVNIDYTGYADLDGDGEVEPFDGGSTQGMGTNLEIGSQSYVDDFEEQLIGSKKGDQVEVNVTFPENYGNTDLAGKDARFDVTINEIVLETADSYFSEVCNASEVKAYPKNIWDEIVAYFDHYAETNSMTTEELFEQVGVSQDDYIRSRAKILLTAHAILAKEGCDTGSEEYNSMQNDFLSYYGFQDIEDAQNQGMTDLELDYTVTYNLALSNLEEMAIK